jgi:predicted ATPase/DNA-binding SARP family transcriptional activator
MRFDLPAQCYNLCMGHLAIFALGPLRIELDGQPLQTSRHKALALLVYLSMQPERQTREMLSTFLWPEYGQKKAFAYLRRTIWELHSLLGDGWLDVDREKIGLNSSDHLSVDVARFQTYLTFIKNHTHPTSAVCPECLATLHKAALLYRGDFLAGFSLRDSANFDDWRFFQQEVLRREYAETLQKLVMLLFQNRSLMEAIAFAQRWLALDTLNEEAHRLLMKSYMLNEQRHAALRQYQDCQRILQAELGIAPDPATTALYEAIASGRHELESEPSEGPRQWASSVISVANWSGKTESRPASNLPTTSTKFIGRQQELNQIAALLSNPDCWLLTLLGPGGIGKTRLAAEAGQAQIDHFPQGVFFISLSSIEDERSISPAIAHSLGLIFRQNGPAPEEQLLDFLREKRMLMILDSFEKLIPWAGLLAQIHSHAPRVKMLVTSRHRLKVQGEWVMDINGLNYPPERLDEAHFIEEASPSVYSAVELFLQCARRTLVAFQALPQDEKAIDLIARLLEGNPLGLELAAAWVSTLSCQEIAVEIQQGLDILDVPLGDIAAPQHSMRAVFNHSWNLLSSREQALLPRLAVFRDSFSRQAAEQVAGISLRELAGLVDKSLIRRSHQGRFDLHDLLRQYCEEKLARQPMDSQETNYRHCAHYCARLARWNKQLGGVDQGQALREIEIELENLQAAWEWAVGQGQVEHLEQAVDGLSKFYLRRARFAEGRDACQASVTAIQSVDLPEARTQNARLIARLLTWQAAFSMNLECFEDAGRFLHKSQVILDNPKLDQQEIIPERIFWGIIQALLANLRYDATAIPHFYEQTVRLSKQTTGETPGFLIYFWRFLMGGGAVSRELYQQIERNLAEVQQSRDPFEIGCTLFVLGIAELFHFYRMEKAEPLLRESCKSFQVVDDPSTQGMIYMALGYLLLVQGKFDDCFALKQRELEIYRDLGDHRKAGIAQAEIGEALCHMGRYREAEEWIRQGMSLLQERSEYEYSFRHRYLGDSLLAQGKNKEAQNAYQFSYQYFQSVNDKGWMLTALTGLSRVELAQGDRVSAWQHARQALSLYNEMQLFTFFAHLSLAEIALLLADQGKIIQALELRSLVLQQGYLAQSRWFADLFGRLIEDASANLPLDEQKAARKRGQNLDFSTTIQTILADHKLWTGLPES